MTSSDVIGIPMRVNSCAATVAASCSLSTSTPLQSKMITETAPARPHMGQIRLSNESCAAIRNRAQVAKLGRYATTGFFCTGCLRWERARRGLIELTLEVGDPFDDEIVGDLALDGMGQDSFGCGNGSLCGGRAHVGESLRLGLRDFALGHLRVPLNELLDLRFCL